MCRVLEKLERAVEAVPTLPSPAGLGAEPVLAEQVETLTAAVVVLQRELGLRMAALETQASGPTDLRGDAVRAGLGGGQSSRLRQLGLFAAEHSLVREAWAGGSITCDQVAALRSACGQLPTPELRSTMLEQVLPYLPELDAKRSRRLIDFTVDQLDPGDPDMEEQSDHAARYLAWSRAPDGGLVLDGYLPAAEADAFTRALDALVEDLRVAGDGLSPSQRRVDALSALVAIAGDKGLPTGGGLPAVMTLTVSLTEAQRVAERDPVKHGRQFERQARGGASIGDHPAGDAAVRFGLCCGAVTPVLGESAERGSPLSRIAGARVEPLAVGRGVRLATPAQRKALQARDGGCAIRGCAVGSAYTQPHHVTPWAFDGATDLDNLVPLCFVHHRQVELGRYTFVRRDPDHRKPDGALEHPLWWIVPPAA